LVSHGADDSHTDSETKANSNLKTWGFPSKKWPCRHSRFPQDTPSIMNKATTTCVLALLCLCASSALGNDIAIRTLLQVDGEGQGNAKASAAWASLVRSGSPSLLPALQALDRANPLAANWIRSAIDAIAQGPDAKLPVPQLVKFLEDHSHNPKARRLAYELILSAAPDKAGELIDTMLDDPSVELRRDAVQNVLSEAEAKNSPALYKKALDAARDLDQVDKAKDALVDAGEPVDLPRHFGFLMHWKVIGPFDNSGRNGFDTVFPPEQETDFTKSYPGKSGNVQWSDYQTSDIYGMVDINQHYGHLKEVVAYAHHTYESPEARSAEMRLGCKNAWKVWHNGKLVFERDEYHRGMRIDQYTLPVQLVKGSNTLLVKLCQNEQKESWTDQWQFQLRICDSTGTAILAENRLPTPQPKAPERRPKRKN
jgi:hypothetical protein